MMQKTCITLTGAGSQWRTRNDTLSECAQLPGANLWIFFRRGCFKISKVRFQHVGYIYSQPFIAKLQNKMWRKPTYFSENNEQINESVFFLVLLFFLVDLLICWFLNLQAFKSDPLGALEQHIKNSIKSLGTKGTPKKKTWRKPPNLKRWNRIPKSFKMLFHITFYDILMTFFCFRFERWT